MMTAPEPGARVGDRDPGARGAVLLRAGAALGAWHCRLCFGNDSHFLCSFYGPATVLYIRSDARTAFDPAPGGGPCRPFPRPFQLGTILWNIWARDPASIDNLAMMIYALTAWNAGPAALAGVYSWNRSQEKMAVVAAGTEIKKAEIRKA